MIFTTYWFFAFLVLVATCYWMLPRKEWRLWFLGLACLVFHAHFAGPAGMAPIMILMLVTYVAGITRDPRACVAAMMLTVAALCFYKYVLFLIGFTVNTWDPSLAAVLSDRALRVIPGAPPLGISFFAFEFLHYLYEVKNGGQPIRNPLRFLLFSIFFPSLVAGPIKRYGQFIPSLEEGSAHVWLNRIGEGVFRIALGFAKKVIIADNLTLYVDSNQPQFESLGMVSRWLVFLAIAGRILMDFSGYSDIAIGVARLLGITLPENFNWPYLARSLQEFWQRWHMSLSNWIRDYVYIPLGGSRHGPARRFLNAMVAFALCGLWHGPAWHFAAWGLYHGLGLSICVSYGRIPIVGSAVKAAFAREPITALVATQLYACAGWLVFFYPLSEALRMARLLLGL